MEKEFVPYEQALELKELGFDRSCFGWYESERSPISVGESWRSGQNSIASPTFSQALRWFREKYGLHPHIFSREGGAFIWCVRWYVDGLQKDIPYDSSNTYEEAELECLKKLISIVKEQK